MRKQVIDKDILLDKAYEIAETEGLSALSIRKLAGACGVSVGAAYRYYPAKEDLTTAVIERFFIEAFHDDFCHPTPGEDYIAFCERLLSEMRETLSRFRSDWLNEIRSLGQSEIAAGKNRERFYLRHMEDGLAMVFENDPTIDREHLPEGIDAQSLSRFVMDNLLEAVRSHGNDGAEKDDCKVLFALLGCALHGGEAGSRSVDSTGKSER